MADNPNQPREYDAVKGGKLWSVETGELLHTLQDSNYIEIESINFGSDGESLAIAFMQTD